ncbi:receptor-like protein kinase FERONIA [Malania oleifera]|uniref:receptor-like protein kinase FERONIA n=1 Tax=Malania oleifera TaxID=397392 RepID=UPI0025ADA45F|nr:receptor-like protein kinase FERONIA [Malania oleifera]
MKNKASKSNISCTSALLIHNIYLCPTFLLCHFLIYVAGDFQKFTTENITIDCGSSGNVSNWQDHRMWTGDTETSSLFTLEERSKPKVSVASSATQPPRTASQIPYSTARISGHEFRYIFPVTAGQKFIRLHFFPASYPGNFDRSKAFFSVQANHFTLLRNFSVALTVDHLKSEVMFREFCINVEKDETLNITFSPSPTPPDSYAFINGIEIVPMPSNLYYSATNSSGIKFVGQQNFFRVENKFALETVYRLNVGGKDISPPNDTGMYREWSRDDDFLPPELPGVLPLNSSIQPSFGIIANYSAPVEVYRTARSMGMNKTKNLSYNLTWKLPVDPGFNYLVRLHFCEFEPNVTKESDREFHIYIANQTAEPYADVISWSGGNGVPVYKDYAVSLQNQESLYVALHPNAESRTKYSDAILNGLEVFKISNSYDSLAGPNPNPTPLTPPPFNAGISFSGRENAKMRTKTIAAAAAAFSLILALFLIWVFVIRQRKRAEDESVSSSDTLLPAKDQSLPIGLCRHFSLSEIRAATKDFESALVIGVGGFGDVYKGHIDGGATTVAIKRLKPGSRQGAHEFRTEIEMLSQLRHVHLVSLIGFCNDGGEMILVYDYFSRGSLRDHLYKTDNAPLTWKQRLAICLGAARGLHYLHAGAKRTIIHRDVKTTNILLDSKWVAKVSDFGLSKMGPNNAANAHVTTVVKGSFGYLDPEYFRRQQLTEKSDVYSFGVVLLEVLCGRPPLNQTLPKEQVSLAEWGRICYQSGTLEQIVDPHLNGQIASECLKIYGEIAVNCLVDEGIRRPSMGDVVGSLEFAMSLQEGGEQMIKLDPRENVAFYSSDGTTSGSSWLMTPSSVGESASVGAASSDTDRGMTGIVFSEIMNPEAR